MAAVLITGENSFIGNSFIRFSENRTVKKITVRNINTASIDFSGFNVVLHLAAIVHVKRGIDPQKYYLINRDLSIKLARSAKSAGIRHFIYMSSSKVYGDNTSGTPLKEDSECHPEDDYGRSKYEAEQELIRLSDHNFIVSIIRTPVVYGIGMKANMLMLIRLVKYSPVLPIGNVTNKRNYTFVENLVGFIDRIIELKIPGIFIAMDSDPVSTIDMVKYISESLGKRCWIMRMPVVVTRLMHILFPHSSKRLFSSFILDNTLTRKILAWSPPETTRTGINKTITSS